MKRMAGLLLSIVLAAPLGAQDAPGAGGGGKTYSFILRDSPARFLTLRQLDQDYLSGYRLLAGLLDTNLSPVLGCVIKGAWGLFLFKTLTHEEAHRSILTGEDIGAVSHPFPFSERSGYVDGVTDATLLALRDSDLPTFIRLHTAGFESDYLLATREETLMSWGQESFKNLAVEYLLRKMALVRYFTEGFFKHDTDGPEEADELKRDVVGNDLYGAIRHLFRPAMAYTRYTRYADLTDQELRYLRRVEWRTFLNLANANIVGVRGFRLSEDLRANVGLGHCLGPFGDFIDEKLWLAYKAKVRINAYLREFQNLDHWFLAAGIGLFDYPLSKHLCLSAEAHYWNQPVGLGFTEGTGRAGGAVDVTGRYKLRLRPGAALGSLSLDLGVIYKSAGFLPEELGLDEHFGVRLGMSLGLRGL
jgi:hypothetical protein